MINNHLLVVRKLSALLILELAFRNEKAQMMICEYFSFTPIKGQVALNPIPRAIIDKLRRDPQLLMMIKNASYNNTGMLNPVK